MVWVAGAALTAAQLNANAPQEWTAWSPTITAQTGAFTSVSGSGRYARHGDTIVWQASITITTVGTAAGAVILPLPVTARATNLHVGTGRENTATGAALLAYTITTSTAYILTYNNTSAIGAARTLILSGLYEAA